MSVETTTAGEGGAIREGEERGATEQVRLAKVRTTVLVVEDDPESLEVLIELLGQWGYRPVAAGSAEEAQVEACRRPFAAAVVDVFLPGQNGASLIAVLRERYPGTLLIAVSGQGDPAMARHCKGVGADLFMGKPLRPEDLAEALRGRHLTWH